MRHFKTLGFCFFLFWNSCLCCKDSNPLFYILLIFFLIWLLILIMILVQRFYFFLSPNLSKSPLKTLGKHYCNIQKFLFNRNENGDAGVLDLEDWSPQRSSVCWGFRSLQFHCSLLSSLPSARILAACHDPFLFLRQLPLTRPCGWRDQRDEDCLSGYQGFKLGWWAATNHQRKSSCLGSPFPTRCLPTFLQTGGRCRLRSPGHVALGLDSLPGMPGEGQGDAPVMENLESHVRALGQGKELGPCHWQWGLGSMVIRNKALARIQKPGMVRGQWLPEKGSEDFNTYRLEPFLT